VSEEGGAGFSADFINNHTACVDDKVIVSDREKNLYASVFPVLPIKNC
jgi:hypothetical protein